MRITWKKFQRISKNDYNSVQAAQRTYAHTQENRNKGMNEMGKTIQEFNE